MNPLRRRRARLLISRGQPFADEELLAVANFTWVGNSMGSQPGVRGRADLAGGLPDWTLIGAGATRLFVIECPHLSPDRGAALLGAWPLRSVGMTQERFPRRAGFIPLGSWRAVRFEFPDREPAVLQPFGAEVDALLDVRRAAPPHDAKVEASQDRWDDLIEVVLLTTSAGPVADDLFFVLRYTDGTDTVIPLGDEELLTRLQQLPGFDNEAFIEAMGFCEEGISVLWRRDGVR